MKKNFANFELLRDNKQVEIEISSLHASKRSFLWLFTTIWNWVNTSVLRSHLFKGVFTVACYIARSRHFFIRLCFE